MTLRENLKLIPGAVPLVRVTRKLFEPERQPAPQPIWFNPTYNEDHLATDHFLTTNERFEAAYKRAFDMGLSYGEHLKWRAHVTCWAASIGAKLGGDFVECGVNLGFHSRIVCDYLESVPTFYLLDTYKGFDAATLSPKQAKIIKEWYKASGKTGDWQNAMYVECYDAALKTFADKPQCKIIRGTVPGTLSQVTAEKISYLSLDMNCPMPEIAAIEYFWPKMIPGTVTVLDDYGWEGHEEQRLAFDEWSKRNNAPILSMPTGQGIIIKN